MEAHWKGFLGAAACMLVAVGYQNCSQQSSPLNLGSNTKSGVTTTTSPGGGVTTTFPGSGNGPTINGISASPNISGGYPLGGDITITVNAANTSSVKWGDVDLTPGSGGNFSKKFSMPAGGAGYGGFFGWLNVTAKDSSGQSSVQTWSSQCFTNGSSCEMFKIVSTTAPRIIGARFVPRDSNLSDCSTIKYEAPGNGSYDYTKTPDTWCVKLSVTNAATSNGSETGYPLAPSNFSCYWFNPPKKYTDDPKFKLANCAAGFTFDGVEGDVASSVASKGSFSGVATFYVVNDSTQEYESVDYSISCPSTKLGGTYCDFSPVAGSHKRSNP